MRKIIIIKNKKTNKLTVKILKIKDIEIVNGYLFIRTNNKKYIFIYIDDNDYIVQTPTGNNLNVFYTNYVLKKDRYF